MAGYEVRVSGPDDVLEFDDELVALRQANGINKTYLQDRMRNPDSEVLCVATVHQKGAQMWQHDETGRLCESVGCPGGRWGLVSNAK